jgi:hypothetical protein
VKVAKVMSLKKRLYRPDRLSDFLCEELKEIRTSTDPGEGKLTTDDLDSACQKAFDLALKLRSCKARFEWRQDAGPTSIPPGDVEAIGTLNIHNASSQPRAVRVLFGPVYKIVEGGSILLRKGEVLNSE